MNDDKIGCESYTIRRVASIEKLNKTFDVIGAQFTSPVARTGKYRMIRGQYEF
jgi:hypothetical protein